MTNSGEHLSWSYHQEPDITGGLINPKGAIRLRA
jgi:hypothetical protein